MTQPSKLAEPPTCPTCHAPGVWVLAATDSRGGKAIIRYHAHCSVDPVHWCRGDGPIVECPEPILQGDDDLWHTGVCPLGDACVVAAWRVPDYARYRNAHPA
jgi:hypothetical protein